MSRIGKSIVRKQIRGCQGLGEERREDWLVNGCGVSFWIDERVLELEVVAQHLEYTKCHWIAHLKLIKMVDFMLHVKG